MKPYENTLKKRLSVLLKFLSVNYIFSLLIELQYIFSTHITTIDGKIFAYATLFSNTLMFYILIFILLFPFMLIKTTKLHYIIAVPLIILMQIIAVTDVAIYKIFKFHINAVVINFFTTEGSWDSIYLGFGTNLTIALIIIFFIIIEFLLMKKLFIKKQINYTKRKSKKLKYIIIFFLIVILIDKLYFAYADLYNKTQVTRLKKLYPLYQPLTVKRTAYKLFGLKTFETENKLKFDKKSSMLNYPLKKIKLPEKPKKYNMILIVLDCYRYDMMNKDVTPTIYELSKKSQYFAHHFSGGNATRFGIFSIFYGIYAYNWHQFLGERQSPVLMDTLQKMGYDFSINSSTKLTFPEFRKTAFRNIEDKVNDNFKGKSSYEKDRNQTDYIVKWLKNYKSDKPFFNFVFLDSSHSRVYPPEFEKFKTDSKTTNYLFINKKTISNSKLNYINSLWYEDHLVKEILDTLKEKNMMDNTIIMITGDHGEEFNEHGFFGHNSAFTPEQIGVPMVFYIPDMKPKKYTKMTSHLDIPATLLNLTGINTAANKYSNGFSIFDNKTREYNVSCSWNNCAYTDNENTIVFSMESYNAGLFEVRDKNYKEVKNANKVLNKKMKNLMKVMKEFSLFFK